MTRFTSPKIDFSAEERETRRLAVSAPLSPAGRRQRRSRNSFQPPTPVLANAIPDSSFRRNLRSSVFKTLDRLRQSESTQKRRRCGQAHWGWQSEPSSTTRRVGQGHITDPDRALHRHTALQGPEDASGLEEALQCVLLEVDRSLRCALTMKYLQRCADTASVSDRLV